MGSGNFCCAGCLLSLIGVVVLKVYMLKLKGIYVKKVGLKLNIQKIKIMVSGLITSWQIDGETMETVTDFIFLGSKITADGDCSMKLKDACSLEEKLLPTWTAY